MAGEWWSFICIGISCWGSSAATCDDLFRLASRKEVSGVRLIGFSLTLCSKRAGGRSCSAGGMIAALTGDCDDDKAHGISPALIILPRWWPVEMSGLEDEGCDCAEAGRVIIGIIGRFISTAET